MDCVTYRAWTRFAAIASLPYLSFTPILFLADGLACRRFLAFGVSDHWPSGDTKQNNQFGGYLKTFYARRTLRIFPTITPFLLLLVVLWS